MLHTCQAPAGYTEIVKALLDAGAEVDAASDDGRTALHRAAHQGKSAWQGGPVCVIYEPRL